MSEIKLETRVAGSIKGNFYVPSYQRGYRWGTEEVVRLLDDIYANRGKNYCLQPVVVKTHDDYYELIDGQQRLTTIYLIRNYMQVVAKGFIKGPDFSITYETRAKSEEFLAAIDLNRRDENIDFWFICNAYEAIKDWFDSKDDLATAMTDINKALVETVKIIWYEVDSDEDSIALFARLNIGKIPLTSAELVKALFLNSDSDNGMSREKQEEIALQWDNIEKELHNDSLWYFLTNASGASYQTRIDLVLDLIAGRQKGERDKYYTFFQFDAMSKTEDMDSIWRKIQTTFLILKDWYENHELYHKIGYLISSGDKTLADIYEAAAGKRKSELRAVLDDMIRRSIADKHNYKELSYEKSNEYDKIARILLLFNVESVRQNGEHTQWFPFEQMKYSQSGKVNWSLEHIHAQHSEGMRTQEAWKEWLRLHVESLSAMPEIPVDLIGDMEEAQQLSKLERSQFEALQERTLAVLSADSDTEYEHSIANLALLNTADNAALNNSTFDVKRNAIIQMDKEGKFIPFCTKMVFLKYYTPSADNQLHFWGEADRSAYVAAIDRVLKDYLPKQDAAVAPEESGVA